MRFLSKRQVKELVTYSFAHTARLEAAGQFPKRVRLGTGRVAYVEDEVWDWMNARITIRISEFSEGGYYYDIWKSDQTNEDAPESDDGGLCTTTMWNALGMAFKQAREMEGRDLDAKILERREARKLLDVKCADCAADMYVIVRGHHHTEEGVDLTGL